MRAAAAAQGSPLSSRARGNRTVRPFLREGHQGGASGAPVRVALPCAAGTSAPPGKVGASARPQLARAASGSRDPALWERLGVADGESVHLHVGLFFGTYTTSMPHLDCVD